MARRYERIPVYGPFHRRANGRTQTASVMRAVLESGELWGRPPRNSDVAAVQAFSGPLPDFERGFEFFAMAEPDRPDGTVMYWRARADGHVWGDDDWARMRVLVTKVRQEL